MDKSQFVGRDYLKLADYSPDEVLFMLDISADLKGSAQATRSPQILSKLYGSSNI